MVDEVHDTLNTSYLCEGKDVGYPGADVRVRGTPKVDLIIGAQGGETDLRFRPGSKDDEHVRIGVKSAVQIFTVPRGAYNYFPADTYLHGVTCPGTTGECGGYVYTVESTTVCESSRALGATDGLQVGLGHEEGEGFLDAGTNSAHMLDLW